MSGQQYIPKQTDEEREARRVKLEAETERRAEWRWGNYFRENATGAATTVECLIGRACRPACCIGDEMANQSSTL